MGGRLALSSAVSQHDNDESKNRPAAKGEREQKWRLLRYARPMPPALSRSKLKSSLDKSIPIVGPQDPAK